MEGMGVICAWVGGGVGVGGGGISVSLIHIYVSADMFYEMIPMVE